MMGRLLDLASLQSPVTGVASLKAAHVRVNTFVRTQSSVRDTVGPLSISVE